MVTSFCEGGGYEGRDDQMMNESSYNNNKFYKSANKTALGGTLIALRSPLTKNQSMT